MSNELKKEVETADALDFIEFVPAEDTVSSEAFVKPETEVVEALDAGVLSPSATLEDMPPAFRELALPKLPELTRENRARLQMQSPNRLFFYWSVGANPFHRLNKALGTQTASYTLVVKLVDIKREIEQIHAADAEGSWWFDVEADGEYRAEIGFYAPNRPYVRALFSNVIETPRKSPSTRVDTEADWQVSAAGFARVLEVAGFAQDAFEVTVAGDDPESADAVTHEAFAELIGDPEIELDQLPADEIRHAMLLLASGASLESLRWQISPGLFAFLQKYAATLSSERAGAILKDRFEIEEHEIVGEEFGPAVFGASSIHFPKRLKTKRSGPKLRPIASPSQPPGSDSWLGN